MGLRMRIGSTLKAANRGFTFVGVLVVLTVMMIAMGTAAQIWHTQMQRENEQDLLFVGHQFQYAIGRYYQSGKGFPPSLIALLGADNDAKLNPRYLRKIYRDPMTGLAEWGLVLGNNSEIVGVHSMSEQAPYKVAAFSDADSALEGKLKYSEWQFVYVPTKAQGQVPAGDVVNGIPRPVPRTGKAAVDSPNGSLTTISRARR